MAYARINTAAAATGFNTALTPTIPVGVVAGNLLLLHTGEYAGGDAAPAVSGWLKLTLNSASGQTALYGRIATGSDTPSVTWGNQFSYAMVAAYSGNPPTLTGIVHAASDNATSSTQVIHYKFCTITAPNCLVITAGQRDKSATADGETFLTYSPFSVINTSIPNGSSRPAAVYNDWIQTTATSTTSGTQSLSIADSNLNEQGYTVALLPGGSSINTAPIAWVTA